MNSTRALKIASIVFALAMLPPGLQAAPQQGNAPSEGQTLHVLVGKSVGALQ